MTLLLSSVVSLQVCFLLWHLMARLSASGSDDDVLDRVGVFLERVEE
jgi:hypothetical protein